VPIFGTPLTRTSMYAMFIVSDCVRAGLKGVDRVGQVGGGATAKPEESLNVR